MNCPRCGKEMEVKDGKASCCSCRLSVAVTKTVEAPKTDPELDKEPESSETIDPEEIEGDSAEAEGFPEEDNQESEEAKE